MTEKSTSLFKKIDQGYPFYILSAVVAVLLIFTRRPDAFLNPQFWAEDGAVWYAQAYERGFLAALVTPEAGYLQTVSRLTAGFSQLFAFDCAPLVFNAVAVAAKVLVVLFILSPRLANFLPALWMRVLAAFFYLAIPHSYETHANLTNVQWHLALLSCLIIVAAPAATRFWKVFDPAVVALSALSGPFCLLLLPVAALRYYRERDGWLLVLLGVLAAGSLIQGISLLTFERPTRAPLGANINLFLRILGGHLFFSSIFGENVYEWTINRPFWKDGVAVLINLLGLGLLVYALLKAEAELRLLIIFSVLIVAAAFALPAITSEGAQWEFMRYPAVGSRYWLIPIFCFFLVLFWTARCAGSRFLRRFALLLLCLTPIGIVLDWRYPPYRDFDFPRRAAEFNAAPAGAETVIPINPDWEMRLTKK